MYPNERSLAITLCTTHRSLIMPEVIVDMRYLKIQNLPPEEKKESRVISLRWALQIIKVENIILKDFKEKKEKGVFNNKDLAGFEPKTIASHASKLESYNGGPLGSMEGNMAPRKRKSYDRPEFKRDINTINMTKAPILEMTRTEKILISLKLSALDVKIRSF
eukprot:NODE_307_length_10180_cov_0.469596.p1 type:complete len:163 gc:universal NODE_307_length_10180_cov_0.469596:4370-3882(-)